MEKPKKVVGVYDRPQGSGNRMRTVVIVLVAVAVVVGAAMFLLAA